MRLIIEINFFKIYFMNSIIHRETILYIKKTQNEEKYSLHNIILSLKNNNSYKKRLVKIPIFFLYSISIKLC